MNRCDKRYITFNPKPSFFIIVRRLVLIISHIVWPVPFPCPLPCNGGHVDVHCWLNSPYAVFILCVDDCKLLVTANAAIKLRPMRCKVNDATHSTIRSKQALVSLLVTVSGNHSWREIYVTRTLFRTVRTVHLCYLDPDCSSGIRWSSSALWITSLPVFNYLYSRLLKRAE